MKRKEFRLETDPSVVVLLIIGIFLVVLEKGKWKRERERERVIQISEKPFGLGVVWCGVVIECE